MLAGTKDETGYFFVSFVDKWLFLGLLLVNLMKVGG
jgi:hypothetical protein